MGLGAVGMDAIGLLKYRGAGALLATLRKFPARQFTLSELAKMAGVPFASAWRQVRRLAAAGVVETGRVGKSVTVQWHDSEFARAVAGLSEQSVTPQAFAVRMLKRDLGRERQVRQAFVFGSVARGQEKAESDVDLALLSVPGFDANRLLFDAYEKYGAKVVPLTFASEAKLAAFLKGKQAERLK